MAIDNTRTNGPVRTVRTATPKVDEVEQMRAELAKLQAENEALKAKQAQAAVLGLKVSDKGAVSVYGLGRFPVTLYAGQWIRLLGHKDELEKFIKDNHHNLTWK